MSNIREKVKDILIKDFDINENTEIDDAVSFFSRNLAFDAKKLVYLVFCVERDFGIRFSDNDFDDNSFYNFGGFCDIISDHCDRKAEIC